MNGAGSAGPQNDEPDGLGRTAGLGSTGANWGKCTQETWLIPDRSYNRMQRWLLAAVSPNEETGASAAIGS
jgi:hypothetical protein